jgi:hypothetical protein
VLSWMEPRQRGRRTNLLERVGEDESVRTSAVDLGLVRVLAHNDLYSHTDKYDQLVVVLERGREGYGRERSGEKQWAVMGPFERWKLSRNGWDQSRTSYRWKEGGLHFRSRHIE